VARLRAPKFDERLTLVEHLDELRTRIIVSIAVLAVGVGLCFWQNHLLLDLLNGPLPAGKKPTTLSPAEPFLTTFKVSTYMGILLALPILLYQAYGFLLPALSPAERRVIVPFLVLVPLLFVAGVVFATTSYFRPHSSSCSTSTRTSSTSRCAPATTTALRP